MFDFLDSTEDSNAAPEVESENPDSLEEAQADDDSEEGLQEEATGQDDDDTQDDDEELQAIDLDGEEVTLAQIREWKKGGLREQDYTKKTQELSEQRKAVAAKIDELSAISDSLIAGESEIKKLLVSDLDDIDLKELRETDYPEYLKMKETIKEREAKFDEIKSAAARARQSALADEQKAVVDLLGWTDPSKQEKDVAAYRKMATEYGFSERDVASITSAKVMKALVDLSNLKEKASAQPPKAKPARVKFKSSSAKTSQAKTKNASLDSRIDNFFEDS